MCLQISTYLVHHNGKYWKNPSSFDPERFATINQISSALSKVAENDSNSNDSSCKKSCSKQDTSTPQKRDYNQNLVEHTDISETKTANHDEEAADNVKFLPAIDKIEVTRVIGTAMGNKNHQSSHSTTQENDPIRNGCYLPFSKGQRVCIGANFAKVKLKLQYQKQKSAI